MDLCVLERIIHIKEIVQPKLTVLSLFTFPYFITKLYAVIMVTEYVWINMGGYC